MLGELWMMPDRPGGPDPSRSCDHMEKGNQHPEGLHNLATCYLTGNGRPVDLAKARDLYRQAADQGYAKSACAYGNMLIRGAGGRQEIAHGLELCRQAADAGTADAQTDYGGYLLTNQYTTKNAVEARRYLSMAAEKQQHNAEFLLGQIYCNGDGVEKDITQAAMWWIKAYDGGRRDAAFLIGNAAMRVVADGAIAKREAPTVAVEQARKWLAIAAKEDFDPGRRAKASELLSLLEQLLSSKQ